MKRSSEMPGWLAGLVLIGLAAVLAGCGAAVESEAQEATTEKAPEAVVQAAAVNTARAYSARVDAQSTIDSPELPEPVSFTMEGVTSLSGDDMRARFITDYSDLLSSLGADAAEAEGFMPTEMIMLGTVMYMRMPAVSDLAPGGEDWVRMDLVALGKQEGLDFGAILESSAGQDPTQVLSYLGASSDDVQELGHEDVRGVETTRYRATVDLRKYVELAPPDVREAVRSTTERLVEQLGRSTFPVEVWIDADGLARRVSSEFPTPASAGVGATMTYEMYDFGVELDIEAPPEEDVIDYTELMALAG